MSRMLDDVSQHSERSMEIDTHVKVGRHFRGKELPRGCRRICHRVGMAVLGEVRFSALVVLLPPS